MRHLFINRHPWGRWVNFLFALVQMGDSIVRVGSFGLLATYWTVDFSRHQAEKMIQRIKAARAEK